jgi:hypothetical protein
LEASRSRAVALAAIAVHESFNTFVGPGVEVSKGKEGPKIERVVCAVDCGVAVNPNIVAMQMESGIGYGLSAALGGAITLKDGVVEQSNFHDYPVVRMNQMPRIEVHIVPSREKPSGVGEPSTPVIAPALANALLALEGKSPRAAVLDPGNLVRMTIKLNHTIVHSKDPQAAARFFAEVFGLDKPRALRPFLDVEVQNEVTLAFLDADGMEIQTQHYAFLVSERSSTRSSAAEGARGQVLGRSGAEAGRQDQPPLRRARRLLRGPERPPARDHHQALRQRAA